ncbi:MAG: hypothetical protein LC793_14180 [Thermomicrobia bacterium]|nr:hypothetical protein [Thermomicrobia bacterium]
MDEDRATVRGNRVVVERDRAVNRPLRDHIAAEDAILGIAPCPLRAAQLLHPRRPRGDAGDAVRGTAREEVAVVFVEDQRVGDRIEVDGIADAVAGDVEIVVEEKPGLARPVGVIRDMKPAYEQRPVEVHRVLAEQRDIEAWMVHRHFSDERVLAVFHSALPFPLREPRELTIYPDAGATGVAHRVIFLPDIRIVNIANLIREVEADQ